MRLYFRLYSVLVFLASPLLVTTDICISEYLALVAYFTVYTYVFMIEVCSYDLMESLNKRIRSKRTIPKATVRKQNDGHN